MGTIYNIYNKRAVAEVGQTQVKLYLIDEVVVKVRS